MLTLSKLINNTPEQIVLNSRNVTGRVLKSYWDVDNEGKEHRKIMIRAKDIVTRNPPKTLVLSIYGTERDITKNKAWVYCNCEYFKFYLEVALSLRGSSSIIEATKQLPVNNNPRLTPYLCKHILSAIPQIRRLKFDRSLTPTEKELRDPTLRSLKDFIP